MIGLDALPALGVEPKICKESIEELRKRLAGTGLENFIPTDLGDTSKTEEAAISLVVKSLEEGINYVAALYIAWLLAVKSACPEEFQNAAVFLAVVGFDALWSALSKVVEISGIDPKLLKTLFEVTRAEGR